MRQYILTVFVLGVLLSGVSCGWLSSDLTKKIGDIEISFPKDLTVLDVPSTTGLYDNVKFLDPKDPAGASIELNVPNADIPDAESMGEIPPDALDVVTEQVKLGARTGTRTSYRIARSIESGIEESYRVVMERYETEYENAPLHIIQTIPEGSDELSDAWTTIKNSLIAQYGESEL